MTLWMRPDLPVEPPFVAVYRNCFELKQAEVLKFRYSADERCQLFLDGERVSDGPERGDPGYWYYQNFKVSLNPGKHCLTARVLCFGKDLTGHAQMSIRHGLWVDGMPGQWEWQIAEGFNYRKPFPDWGTFPRFEAEPANWDILAGRGGEWRPVAYFEDDRELHAPELPPMLYEPETAYRREGNRIIFDDYVCVWPEYVFSGEGTVTIRWGESTYDEPEINVHNLKGVKGRRNGPYLISSGNTLKLPGGTIRWVDYWWQAGRHLEIECDGPILEKVTFHRTGYPYRREWQADSSSPALNRVLEMAYRTLEACSHETYMDCPYYEQLMYIGDARLEALSTYAVTSDTRLVKKALRQLARSRQPDGSILSRYPGRVRQLIPPFCMIYIMALHDYALWQDDPEFITELLPTARGIVDYLGSHYRNGLLYLPEWRFIDWVQEWTHGEPPGSAETGTSSPLNYQAVLALQQMSALEKHFGSAARATADARFAQELEEAIWKTYYNPQRGLLANDFEQQHYSEHSQILALLSGSYPQLIDGLRREKDLPKAGIYFSFYYLEACYRHRLPDLFYNRFSEWFKLEKQGLKTLPEEFNNPRSDCHAWSSHVLYHYFASIMGIRPAGFGCRELDINPLEGLPIRASGITPLLSACQPEMA